MPVMSLIVSSLVAAGFIALSVYNVYLVYMNELLKKELESTKEQYISAMVKFNAVKLHTEEFSSVKGSQSTSKKRKVSSK